MILNFSNSFAMAGFVFSTFTFAGEFQTNIYQNPQTNTNTNIKLDTKTNSQHFHPHPYNGSAWCGPDIGAKLADTTAQSQSRARPELGSD